MTSGSESGMWRKRLIDYLGGERLARLELALGRDPDRYVLDTRNAAKIPETDIHWFFRVLDLGILRELPNGDFHSPRPGAAERLYSHGDSSKCPVPVGISIEPVISLGAMARLIETFGWPSECLGVQAGSWGFDLTCYAPGSEKVILQCEVKTKERDIERMCAYFEARLNGANEAGQASPTQRKNWDAKLAELASTGAQLLWALGPGGFERVYRVVTHGADGGRRILPASSEDLHFTSI